MVVVCVSQISFGVQPFARSEDCQKYKYNSASDTRNSMEPAQALVDASANNEDAGSEGDVILEVPLEVVNKSKDQQIQFLLQRVCSLEKELRATKERLQQLESPGIHSAF